MTNTISINDLLPAGERIRKIQTGSELFLAYELNKYAKLMLGKEVSLADVSIAKELLTGEHFSFVVLNGLDVGFVPERDTLADITKKDKYFFKGTIDGVAFTETTPDKVVYSFTFDPNANRILHGDNRSAGYVSLLAYIMVKAKAEGAEKIPTLVIDHERYNPEELEYVDLFVLKNHGNTVIKNIIDVRYGSGWGLQPDWEAFVIYHRQLGVMNQEYSITEKFKYLRKNFEVGDVVLLYTRTKAAIGKSINKLKSCYPAVITYFDGTNIELTHYPIVETRLTRRVKLNDIIEDLEEENRESIYTTEDFERFSSYTESYNLTEIGIDTRTWVEQTFILKPHDFDGSVQHFKVNGRSTTLFLSTLETIYAVFEDRGVEYNKEKFLQTYFHSKNRTPIYDQFVVQEEETEEEE